MHPKNQRIIPVRRGCDPVGIVLEAAFEYGRVLSEKRFMLREGREVQQTHEYQKDRECNKGNPSDLVSRSPPHFVIISF
jgi:hypothetical protein